MNSGFTSTVVADGGTLVDPRVFSGATLIVQSGGTTGNTRVDRGGMLIVSQGASLGAITDNQGTIDLASLAFNSGGTVTLNAATDVLSVTEGSTTSALQLAGQYVSASFALTADFAGGTVVNESVACYGRGTLILTSGGGRPVEDLRIADILITACGHHRPVKWIGTRSYAGRFLAANPNVQPVHFHAGSLGGGLPQRDLLVSPDHAMFLDGLLIPARSLLNGTTIIRDRVERVDYYHVELDSHDILLAEGAPSESFVDDDSRGMVHNANEFAELYPHASWPGRFCAPRVEHGAELEAIRKRLAGVAGEIARAG